MIVSLVFDVYVVTVWKRIRKPRHHLRECFEVSRITGNFNPVIGDCESHLLAWVVSDHHLVAEPGIRLRIGT